MRNLILALIFGLSFQVGCVKKPLSTPVPQVQATPTQVPVANSTATQYDFSEVVSKNPPKTDIELAINPYHFGKVALKGIERVSVPNSHAVVLALNFSATVPLTPADYESGNGTLAPSELAPATVFQALAVLIAPGTPPRVIYDSGKHYGDCGSAMPELSIEGIISLSGHRLLALREKNTASGCCGASDETKQRLRFYDVAANFGSVGDFEKSFEFDDNDSCSDSEGKKAVIRVTDLDLKPCMGDSDCSEIKWSRSEALGKGKKIDAKSEKKSSGALKWDDMRKRVVE